jgi:hypothetical protein
LTPGADEVMRARRFFAALQRGDARAMAELLDDQAVLHNMDGPAPVANRHELAERLAGHSPDVEYRLEEIAAAPGFARARFTLLVAEVPGGVALEAHLTFAGERIVSIVVRAPDPPPVE